MATRRLSIPAIAATAVVAATVIAAVIVTGGPSAQREIRLDERRSADLEQIMLAVNIYWIRHKALPLSLDSLVSAHQLTDVPRDPTTHQAYTYSLTGEKTYRVCATFQRPSEEEDGGFARAYGRSWGHHDRGSACFDMEPTRSRP